MADTEQWQEIPSTDYSVSNEGRVASRKFGGWRVLSLVRDKQTGYFKVSMQENGRQCFHSVHALVAVAFLGPKPTPKHEVNHKNGVKTDNRVDNLEWVTHKQNMRHRFDVLGQKTTPTFGENHGMSKVTEAQVREIRWRHSSGEPRERLTADFGISKSQISRLAHGKAWGWFDVENKPTKTILFRARGVKVGTSKMTEKEVLEIRRRCAAGETQKVVAAEYGIDQTAVSKIVIRKSWAWLV